MKLNIINILATLVMCLFNNSFAMDGANEKQEEKVHGIILKAEIPKEKALYFVPSHHHSPLSKFTQTFQDEIFRHSHLILEIHNILISEQIPSPLSLLMQYASQDFIKSIGGFVQSSQEKWSLELYPNIKSKYESTFEQIANTASTMGYDLSHFRNIYTMKPGVVFALLSEIDKALSAVPTTISNTTGMVSTSFSIGMDGHIVDIFKACNKPITGVEKKLDVINSLSLSAKTLDDMIDDIIGGYNVGAYPNSLEDMHLSLLKKAGEKRLMDIASLAIRNKSWMKKYVQILVGYEDSVAVHGHSHFPGEEGLLNLGQQQGWKWSIFQVDGSYLPFTYDAQGDTPFLYEK